METKASIHERLRRNWARQREGEDGLRVGLERVTCESRNQHQLEQALLNKEDRHDDR